MSCVIKNINSSFSICLIVRIGVGSGSSVQCTDEPAFNEFFSWAKNKAHQVLGIWNCKFWELSFGLPESEKNRQIKIQRASTLTIYHKHVL